jgi:hypothetical protein
MHRPQSTQAAEDSLALSGLCVFAGGAARPPRHRPARMLADPLRHLRLRPHDALHGREVLRGVNQPLFAATLRVADEADGKNEFDHLVTFVGAAGDPKRVVPRWFLVVNVIGAEHGARVHRRRRLVRQALSEMDRLASGRCREHSPAPADADSR